VDDLVAVVAADDGEAIQVFQPRSTSSPTACAGPRSISAWRSLAAFALLTNRVRFLDYATLARVYDKQVEICAGRPAALER
jgi:hypothetical protein